MKKFTIILMLALMVSVASARLPFHNVQVKDEDGRKVTTITSVEIYAPDTTTNAVIYSDRALQNVITIPMTTSSTNSTLSNGNFFWYGPDGYDFSITDGSNIMTNAGHLTRTASGNQMTFPSYLTAISSTTYSDAQSATWGTGGDVVNQWINSASALRWTPSADGSAFDIGVSGTTANMDFNVYVGTALGLKIDEGVPSFIWDGGAASINTNSNFTTNINTGTSTGAVNIGSSTSGAITVDSTSTATMNSDGAFAITTSDGSADITVDATAGSVIIDGGEAVADAVIIRATGAAGGIDITSLADIDITTTGTAGEDISITNTGGSIVVTATEAIADAIGLISTGGVDITAAATFDIDVTATGGRIIATASEDVQNTVHIEANGGVLESINIYSNQGTGASATTEHDASVQLQSDDGGISLYTTGNVTDAVRIETNGGANETITINNLQGTSAAAVTIAANAAGGDVNIDSVLGRIEIEAEENVANAVFIIADGDTLSTIKVLNDTGTSATDAAASIQITSDLGGIEMLSSLAAANQIRLNAAGTVAGNAVVLETTDGGIQLNADGAANGDITLDAADVISLTAGDVAGIVTNVGTFEHKGIFFNFSAGIVSASEMIVYPGQGLLCVGLTAGAAEIGTTEGFVGSDTETDFIRFMITMPDDWVDTGTQADVILTFDIDEQATEQVDIDFRMFEYDGAANTTAIITDTIVAADDGARAFKGLVTNSAGIGNEADLKPGSVYIIELTGVAAGDDYDIYGMKMVYRVGLQPSE